MFVDVSFVCVAYLLAPPRRTDSFGCTEVLDEGVAGAVWCSVVPRSVALGYSNV